MNDIVIDTPLPFAEAFALAQRKGILRSRLTSAQLSRLQQQVKQRAVFSAQMDKADVLQSLLDQIKAIVAGSPIEDENGRLRSVPEAKAQLREAMFEAGVPIAPVGTSKIKDFYSDTRRGLMVNTTILDTLGFGQHVAGQNPGALFSVPALELVRFRIPKGGTAAERDWNQRWDDAYDSLSPEDQKGCTTSSSGRLVALKNNPIWQALGDGEGGYTDTLGNPWAPFAFNSGMGQIGVLRDDALALGILDDDQVIEPDETFDLNENLEASADRFDAALRDQLVQGGLSVVDGVLRLAGNARDRADLAFHAINERFYRRDSLGRFATDGGSLSVRDNIRRGRRAIARALRTRSDVRNAMQVHGLGTVHFMWGRPGTARKNAEGATHADGYGISHIQAKRGDEVVRMLPHVLAQGDIVPQGEDPDKRLVKWNGLTAVVKRHNASSSFVVTQVDADLRAKNTGRLPGRSIGPGRRWEPGRYPCPTRPPLLFGKGTAVASNSRTIARSRAAIKTILAHLQEAQ